MSPEERRAARLIALRAELARVSRLSGQPEGVAPRAPVFDKHGRVKARKFARMVLGPVPRAWDRYVDAVEALGFVPAGEYRRATPEAVIRDLRRVALELGSPNEMPTPVEYRDRGRWSDATVILKLCGGRWDWFHAAKIAGLRSKGRPRRRGETRETVIRRIREYAEALGIRPGERGPGAREIITRGVVSASVVQRLFGSAGRAIEAAGYTVDRRRLPPHLRGE